MEIIKSIQVYRLNSHTPYSNILKEVQNFFLATNYLLTVPANLHFVIYFVTYVTKNNLFLPKSYSCFLLVPTIKCSLSTAQLAK